MSSYLASKFSTPSDAYLTSCIEEQKECGRGSRLGNCCNGLKCHQSDDKYICQDPAPTPAPVPRDPSATPQCPDKDFNFKMGSGPYDYVPNWRSSKGFELKRPYLLEGKKKCDEFKWDNNENTKQPFLDTCNSSYGYYGEDKNGKSIYYPCSAGWEKMGTTATPVCNTDTNKFSCACPNKTGTKVNENTSMGHRFKEPDDCRSYDQTSCNNYYSLDEKTNRYYPCKWGRDPGATTRRGENKCYIDTTADPC